MKLSMTSMRTLRKLMQALSDPQLSKDVERMADANDTADLDQNNMPTSSLSLALRQLGLIKKLSSQENDSIHQ